MINRFLQNEKNEQQQIYKWWHNDDEHVYMYNKSCNKV